MTIKGRSLGSVVGVLAFASLALGQTVTMTLTNVNGANAGGVYTSPYYGTVNGSPVVMICDDYATEIGNPWGPWQATATSAATAATTGGRFAPLGQGAYNEVAFLATQLLQNPYSSATDIAISFAIWQIMDPGTGAGKPATDEPTQYDALTATWIQNAQSAVSGGYTGTNVTVYTPVAGGTPASQEFLVVSTPEPVAAAIVVGNLLTVFGLLLFRRRRSTTQAA